MERNILFYRNSVPPKQMVSEPQLHSNFGAEFYLGAFIYVKILFISFEKIYSQSPGLLYFVKEQMH